MEYAFGLLMALGTGAFCTMAGFDRDRSLYPIMLIVIASYYDLFAVVGDTGALFVETAVFIGFAGVSFIGFKTSLWLVSLALVGHGVLDVFHDRMTVNAGAPEWWPMFCATFDIAAGVYLAWRLLSKRIDAQDRSGFGARIRSHVETEIAAAKAAEQGGDHQSAFRHLERAHVLGQSSTVHHVGVHVRMLLWGLRHRKPKEVAGQIVRVIGAITKTWVGLTPRGNTGGANVSAFKPLAIPDDLASVIADARSQGPLRH
jgi:hypothetical protein